MNNRFLWAGIITFLSPALYYIIVYVRKGGGFVDVFDLIAFFLILMTPLIAIKLAATYWKGGNKAKTLIISNLIWLMSVIYNGFK